MLSVDESRFLVSDEMNTHHTLYLKEQWLISTALGLEIRT